MFKSLLVIALFVSIVLGFVSALLYLVWFREEKDRISVCYGQG